MSNVHELPRPGNQVERRAGLYLRISLDRVGAGLGVARQQADCVAEAQRRGWSVLEVYIDNDVSAYSIRRRPAYDDMVTDIKRGRINALVVWHVDRLTRRPKELEEFMELADGLNVALATVQGEIDLATPSGRLFARQLGAFARYEQEHKSERQKSKNEQSARAGKPWVSGMRCFGYDHDGMTIIESEAELLRDVAARLMSGETVRSIIKHLNTNGFRTVTGRPWSAITLRRLITNPRLAGKRTYLGDVVGDGDWPAILPAKTHVAVNAIFDDPTRQANPRPANRARRYLLTGGIAVCGLCGKPMHSQPSNSGKRGYVCRSTEPNAGCGRTRIAAGPVEEAVAERVLTRLASPTVRKRLGSSGPDGEDSELLVAAVVGIEERLTQLGIDYADALMGRTEFLAARTRLTERLQAARQRVAAATKMEQLPAADPKALAQWWVEAPLERQHELVKVVLDHLVVNPATRRGPTGLDEDRLVWVWR